MTHGGLISASHRHHVDLRSDEKRAIARVSQRGDGKYRRRFLLSPSLCSSTMRAPARLDRRKEAGGGTTVTSCFSPPVVLRHRLASLPWYVTLLLLLLALSSFPLPSLSQWNDTLPWTIPVSLVPVASYQPPLAAAAWNVSSSVHAANYSASAYLIVMLPLFSQADDNSFQLDAAFLSSLRETGREAVVMAFIAAELFNSNPLFNASFADNSSHALNLTVQLVIADDGCDPTIAVTKLIGLLDGGDALEPDVNTNWISGVVGPGCTVAAQPCAIIAGYNGLPDISYAATGDDLNDRVTYPTFFRTAPDFASEISAIIPILQEYGWQHLSVMVELDLLQQGVQDDLQQQLVPAGVTFAVESYQLQQTEYSSVAEQLVALRSKDYNAFLLYGSNTTDCINIMAAAYNLSMLVPNNIWIINPDCGLDSALQQTVQLNDSNPVLLSVLLTGQLLYYSAVPSVTPLLEAVTSSYDYLVQETNLTSALYGVPLPSTLQPSYTALLAFDAVMAYLLAMQGMVTEATLPRRSQGSQLTFVLGKLQFQGLTGLVNFSTSTGRRYGLGWDLAQVTADAALLMLGYITLTGEVLVGTPGASGSSSYPLSSLAVDTAVTPLWLDGIRPVDYFANPVASGVSLDKESIGIVIGSILGAVLLLVLCVLCVGVVRQSVTRNARILREAKEEAMRSKEEAELADKLKSQFLSTMSHEIRTPLNGVAGNVSLMATTALTAEQLEYVEGITVSTDHLLTVIDDILDFSAIKSGHLELDVAVVRLQQVVEQALNISYRPAFSSHLEVITFIDPSLPDLIIGDTTRIRQIMANLLSNALKFSNARTGEIVIMLFPTGAAPAVRPLVPLPCTPPVDGLFMVGDGVWQEDALDEKGAGRVVADVATVDNGGKEMDDAERERRQREDRRLKRMIRALLSKLKAKKEAEATASGQHRDSDGKDGTPLTSPTLRPQAELEMLRVKPVSDYSITINTDPRTAAASLSSSPSSSPPSSLLASDMERLSVSCTVEDQGVGISAESQRKLFSRFQQVHVGYPGGTGLGLAISVFLSQLMGGTMWVVSRVGLGSRFGFSFTSSADPRVLGSYAIRQSPPSQQKGEAEEDAEAAASPSPPQAETAALRTSPPSEAEANETRPILPDSPGIARSTALSPPAPRSPRAHHHCPLYSFPRLPKPRLGLSVLLVDDNLSLLRLTATTLTSWDCQVYCASTPAAAMSFVCLVHRLPVQPLRMDETEADTALSSAANSPPSLQRELDRTSPRASAVIAASIPSRLDVIMIDYHLAPAKERAAAGNGDTAQEERKELEDSSESSGATGRLNGLQLARAIASRLMQQHRKRILKAANEVYVASSQPAASASPTQLRRRLVNIAAKPSVSSRIAIPRPIQENHAGSDSLPPLHRPSSLPDRAARSMAPLSSSSPLLHNDRLSTAVQQSMPVILLMVGLAEEAALTAHYSPQKETALTGKLRKPLSETQMLRALETVRSRQREEDERSREKNRQKESASLKELRATSAPAQHSRNPSTATAPPSPSPSGSASPSPPPSSVPAVTSPASRHLLAARLPLRLLYAEDNLVNQRLLTRMLKKYGYDCALADNGQIALDMVSNASNAQSEEKSNAPAPFDVVFMDMQMPVMGGVEASRRIRELYNADSEDGDEHRPFIVGVTANAMESDKQKCLEVMDDYMPKPVSFAMLEQALLKWGGKVLMRNKRQQQQQSGSGAADSNGAAGQHPDSAAAFTAFPDAIAEEKVGDASDEAAAVQLPAVGPALTLSISNGSSTAAGPLSSSSTSSLSSPSPFLLSPYPPLFTPSVAVSSLPSVDAFQRFGSNSSHRSLPGGGSSSETEEEAGSDVSTQGSAAAKHAATDGHAAFKQPGWTKLSG